MLEFLHEYIVRQYYPVHLKSDSFGFGIMIHWLYETLQVFFECFIQSENMIY